MNTENVSPEGVKDVAGAVDPRDKMIAELRAELREYREAEFAAMTKAEKRVAIAKDVLAWIAAGKLRPACGTYFTGGNVDSLAFTGAEAKNVEVREVLDKASGACGVCALGAAFVCTVDRMDDLKLAKLVSFHGLGKNDSLYFDVTQSDMHNYLSGVFSMRQLKLIENAFEGKAVNTGLYGAEAKAALVYNKGFDKEYNRNSSRRMERVMHNIIDNKGTFKPLKKPKSRKH